MFGMISGIENGLTRSGPRSRSVSWQSWNDFSPPMPVATAAPIAVRLGADVEPGVLLGLPRGGDDELREAVHAARLLAVDPVGRVEVLHLARERDRVAGGVELRDRPGARTAPRSGRPTSCARRCRAG